jgi:hypothetical protein
VIGHRASASIPRGRPRRPGVYWARRSPVGACYRLYPRRPMRSTSPSAWPAQLTSARSCPCDLAPCHRYQAGGQLAAAGLCGEGNGVAGTIAARGCAGAQEAPSTPSADRRGAEAWTLRREALPGSFCIGLDMRQGAGRPRRRATPGPPEAPASTTHALVHVKGFNRAAPVRDRGRGCAAGGRAVKRR